MARPKEKPQGEKNKGGRPRSNAERDIMVYMFVRRGLEAGLSVKRSYEVAGRMLFGDKWFHKFVEDRPVLPREKGPYSSFVLSDGWWPGILDEPLTHSGMRAAYARGLDKWRELEKKKAKNR